MKKYQGLVVALIGIAVVAGVLGVFYWNSTWCQAPSKDANH